MSDAGMSNPGMSGVEQNVSAKIREETTAAAGWAQSAARQIGSRLKKTGAELQKASLPLTASSAAETERPAMERAEESLDRAGEKIGLFAATFSRQIRRSVALAREEAEDVLAEAQSLRHKDR